MPELNAQKTRIFLSYSRRDAEFVDRLSTALKDRGYDAYVDREDISGGEAWRPRLEQLILNADAVAFVLSPDSVASPICDWETSRTVELGKRLIPLSWRSLEEGRPPPKQLSDLNYIFFDADDKFEAGLDRLCFAADMDIVWVREHTRLVGQAAHWEAAGRATDLVLRGKALDDAEAWRGRRPRQAPQFPSVLTAYFEAARSAQRSDLHEEARRLKRVGRLQGLIFGLFLLAGATIAAGGYGVAKILSSLFEQRSNMLAELAREANDANEFGRAARYARAGLTGAHWPVVGFDATRAEGELRRAFSTIPRHVGIAAPHEGGVDYIEYSANGTRIVTRGIFARDARVWDEGGANISAIIGHEGRILSARLSPDGSRLATTSEDGTLRLWNTENGTALFTLQRSEPIRNTSFSVNGSRLVAPGGDDTAVVWDVQSGRALFVMRHAGRVNSAEFGGDMIVTASDDGTARIWDASAGLEQTMLGDGFGQDMVSATLALGGRRVVTTERNVLSGGRVLLWDAERNVMIAELASVFGSTTISVSPDGQRIAISSFLGAGVWSALNGDRIASLNGHDAAILSVAFSPDSQRVATGSEDHSLRIWVATSGHEVGRLVRHRPVSDVDFGPDGLSLISADGNGHLWEIPRAVNIATRSELEAMTCQTLLAGEEAIFFESEVRATPIVEPALDGNVCEPAGLSTRLLFYLGIKSSLISNEPRHDIEAIQP